MSSMFKKKGAPAFKPKIPSARARPAATPAAPAPAAKSVNASVVIDGPVEEPSTDVSTTQKPSDSRTEPQTAEVPAVPESDPAQSRRRRRSSAASTSKDADVRGKLASTAKSNVAAIAEDEQVQVHAELAPSADTTIAKTVEGPPPTTKRSSRQTRASQTAAPVAMMSTSQQPEPPLSIESPAPEEVAPEPQSETVAAAAVAAIAAAAATTATDRDGDESPAAPTAPKPTRRRGRARVNAEAAGEDGDAATTTTTTTRPKRKRTRKTTADGEATAAATTTRPRKRGAAAAGTGDKEATARPRRARSATPEDSENKLVDLQTLKMSDLTRDLHIGKKFSRHDELRERERRARIKTKLNKDGLTPDNDDASPSSAPNGEQQAPQENGGDNPESTPSGDGGGGGSSSGDTAAAAAGPQFRIVDGQIVVDQSSLMMDRHARAAAAQAGQELETVEENDFSRLVTSSSYMRSTSKLRGPNVWTATETELFYRGLGMFGTEFQMISHMFPGKQRRHVKLKFNREERCNPARVDAALTGEKTTKMDVGEYVALTGRELEPVEAIMAEQRGIEERYEAERRRIADEQAETMRRKREELFADDRDKDGDGDGDGAVGTRGGKGRKKKKGKQVEYGLNGMPIA